MTTVATREENIAAHQAAGFTPEQAESLEQIMAEAERRVTALTEAGRLDEASRFATETMLFVLSAFAPEAP